MNATKSPSTWWQYVALEWQTNHTLRSITTRRLQSFDQPVNTLQRTGDADLRF